MARKKRKQSTGVSDEESGVKPETSEGEGADVESAAEEVEESAGFLSSLRSPDSESEPSTSEDDESSGDTVLVTSLWPARVIVTGAPSGKRYEWPSAGSTVEVASDDVPFLREKNRHIRACCGSSGERRYFDL